jgi:hypothetical protein
MRGYARPQPPIDPGDGANGNWNVLVMLEWKFLLLDLTGGQVASVFRKLLLAAVVGGR